MRSYQLSNLIVLKTFVIRFNIIHVDFVLQLLKIEHFFYNEPAGLKSFILTMCFNIVIVYHYLTNHCLHSIMTKRKIYPLKKVENKLGEDNWGVYILNSHSKPRIPLDPFILWLNKLITIKEQS